MLLKISWRNIWRNKRRSLIVLLSIIIGTIAILLTDALSIGMLNQMLKNRVSAHVAHFQIHKNGFSENEFIQDYIPDKKLVEDVLMNNNNIKSFSERIITSGIINSASNSSDIKIIGVQPEKEEKITNIKNSITVGRYLSGKKHEIVISKRLAEKLDVGLGDKIVLMASDLNGNIGSDIFRIEGLYQSVSSEFDKFYIFISLGNAQELLALNDKTTEYAIIINDLTKLNLVKKELSNKLKGQYEISSYEDLLPLMIIQMDLYKESMSVFYLIIGLALILGIVNTMLMSVFERIKEFGILMAIGMKNINLFFMIISEAFFLGIFGTLLGLFLGMLIYIPLSNSGLNLSIFADSLASFGAGSIIYPTLTVESVLKIITILPIITISGSIYPAIKTIKYNPETAIRYI
jgi:putative ABC transport system permease protein